MIEWMVVAAILVGLFALLYPALQQGRNPKGPHGKTVPTAVPEEANRIVHATGISIVAPENWDQIHDQGPDVPFLRIAARGRPGARLKSVITIERTEAPDETALGGTTRVSFHEFSGYERMGIDRASTFDDPAMSSYSLYVDAAGEWWLITWVVADALRKLPPEIKKYMDTIRLPGPTTSSEPLCSPKASCRR